jgi:hypothetical protein
MKKVKVILIIIVSLCITNIIGCSGLRTPPWTDREIEQMKAEEQSFVPLAVYRF